MIFNEPSSDIIAPDMINDENSVSTLQYNITAKRTEFPAITKYYKTAHELMQLPFDSKYFMLFGPDTIQE